MTQTFLSRFNSSDSKSLLKVYVQPGAKKNEIIGLHGDPARLKIKIKAPPEDGEANSELINFLAKYLGISKSKIAILRGDISRQKDLVIDVELAFIEPYFISFL